MNIKLTTNQKNNLLQLLNRVEVKGVDEANAFLEIVQIIAEAKEEDNKELKQ